MRSSPARYEHERAHERESGRCRLLAVSIVAGAVLLASAAVRAEVARSIAIDGDAAIARELEPRLIARGFAIDPAATARATISQHGDDLEVAATDGAGRTAHRTLTDLETAAAWIESWVRTDLYASLLAIAPPALPDARRPIRAADIQAAIETEHPSQRAPHRERAACPTQIGARAETAVGNDGRPVIGGAANAATEQIACIGVEGRVGATQLANATDERLLAEALLEAGWPIVLGPFDLLPSAGFGFVWQRTVRKEEFAESTWRPRLELSLNAALRFAPNTALEMMIAWSVAPTAHTEKFYPYGTGTELAPGDPGKEKLEKMAIAGEPWFLVRFGLGLRFDFGAGR